MITVSSQSLDQTSEKLTDRSSFSFSATSSAKTSPKDENASSPIGGGDGEEAETATNGDGSPGSESKDAPNADAASSATAAASSFFSSAWSNLGGLTGGSGANAGAKEEKEKTEEGENNGGEGEEGKEEGGKFSYETGLAGLTSAFSTFGKAATLERNWAFTVNRGMHTNMQFK